MTLVDFLLARITEDEEALQRPDDGAHCDVDEDIHYGPARVLAECEAKRRILEYHAWCVGTREIWARHGYPHTPDGSETSMERTLRFLANVYADHPDYQPEWKP